MTTTLREELIRLQLDHRYARSLRDLPEDHEVIKEIIRISILTECANKHIRITMGGTSNRPRVLNIELSKELDELHGFVSPFDFI